MVEYAIGWHLFHTSKHNNNATINKGWPFYLLLRLKEPSLLVITCFKNVHTHTNKCPKRKIKFFLRYVLKNANECQIIVHTLRRPYVICIMRMISILSSQNGETNFIHNNQYFIHWRNALGKGGINAPWYPNRGSFPAPPPLSLSRVAWQAKVVSL